MSEVLITSLIISIFTMECQKPWSYLIIKRLAIFFLSLSYYYLRLLLLPCTTTTY